MKEHRLSFGTIIILEDNLAEVIVDEGVVMDEVMVDEYHDFLLNSLEAPFGLLVNRKNSYSYNFEAQKTISNLKEIKLVAILNHSWISLMSTKTIMNLNDFSEHRVFEMFTERKKAVDWLKKSIET